MSWTTTVAVSTFALSEKLVPNVVVVSVGKFVVLVAKPLRYVTAIVLGVQTALRVTLLEVTNGEVAVVPSEVFQPPKVYPVRDKVPPLLSVIPFAPVVNEASSIEPKPPFTLYEIKY